MPAVLTPIERYLRQTDDYEPDAEYIDGEIELRAVGEYDHATWQTAIQSWFQQHSRDWTIRVRCELRVQVSRTRYRVPDVVVFDRSLPIEQILTYPPIAVFEVLSPEDHPARMSVKLADYEVMGIRTIRMIEPWSGAISSFVGGELVPLASPIEEIAGTLCTLDWSRIRELLDS